jgi:hypothetical protein
MRQAPVLERLDMPTAAMRADHREEGSVSHLDPVLSGQPNVLKCWQPLALLIGMSELPRFTRWGRPIERRVEAQTDDHTRRDGLHQAIQAPHTCRHPPRATFLRAASVEPATRPAAPGPPMFEDDSTVRKGRPQTRVVHGTGARGIRHAQRDPLASTKGAGEERPGSRSDPSRQSSASVRLHPQRVAIRAGRLCRSGLDSYKCAPSAALTVGLVFGVTLGIFRLSPVDYIRESDTKNSMLLSQSLLDYGIFALDHYAIPHLPPSPWAGWVANGHIYQLELVNNHLYDFFPPGGPVLSVPYVGLMKALGVSAANADRTYNAHGELQIQASLAALLMAALAAVFFLTSQCLLPLGWSVLVAFGRALGTQVWSTASRAVGGDAWAIFLLGLVVFMLLAQEMGRGQIHAVLLASLLSWMYFARPTNAVQILAITAYVLMFHRRILFWYALTGALWCALFVVYSWWHFGQMLPNYYVVRRLGFGSFWEGVLGHLVSPSRGLFVYVPVLLFVAYLPLQYRHALKCPGGSQC